MKHLFIIAFALTFGPQALHSQDVSPSVVFNAAGGTYGDGRSYWRFDWSFGEAALVSTFSPSDSSLFLTQGFLQPIVPQPGLSPYIAFFATGEYYIFPNPTTGRFEVNFSVRQAGRLDLQLTDASGRSLMRKVVRYNGWGHIEKFDLSGMPNGTYFVIATLTPDPTGPNNGTPVARHSGFRIVKIR